MTYFSPLRVPPLGSDETALAKAETAKEICLSSARTVSELLEIQRSNWGLDPMPVTNTQFIFQSLFILMDDLDNPESSADFFRLSKGLTFPARRWLLTKGMFRMVQIIARKQHEDLPEDIKRLFNDFETKYWRAEDRARISSAYPVFASSIRQQEDYIPDDLELDKFLEKWDDQSLAGKE